MGAFRLRAQSKAALHQWQSQGDNGESFPTSSRFASGSDFNGFIFVNAWRRSISFWEAPGFKGRIAIFNATCGAFDVERIAENPPITG
ncbi:MAG: hypothetical protein M5U34_11925 [Chloroflexi bacterium]|nr:hypothetical protein [Chloroflexota bacterium]